jgi:hypothetical protein
MTNSDTNSSVSTMPENTSGNNFLKVLSLLSIHHFGYLQVIKNETLQGIST